MTVSWTCGTTSPATVTSCGPAPVVLNTDGANQSASGTAVDSSGFDVSNTVNGKRLDDATTTYPSPDAALAGGLDQLRNALGW